MVAHPTIMADVGVDDVLDTRAYIEECRTATGAYDESLRCLEEALRIFESMRLAPDVIRTWASSE